MQFYDNCVHLASNLLHLMCNAIISFPELYFLISKFLTAGPLEDTAKVGDRAFFERIERRPAKRAQFQRLNFAFVYKHFTNPIP